MSAPTLPTVPDDLLPRFQEAVRGRYAVEAELGRGAMGVVFLARDLRLDRPVAVKVLALDGEDERARFLREARLAARLSHPHVVPIHAVEEAAGFVFFAMTYVDGGTLAARLVQSGPMPVEEAGRLMREIAWALAYAHAQGIVHRDIKPDNVLLEQGTRRALVTDFGIARPEEDDLGGTRLGTPGFASPEQATGDAADARSDIYALGALGFCLLAGRPPFSGDARSIVTQQLQGPAMRVREAAPGTPRDLAAVVDRCLQMDPGRRYQSAEELAAAIGRAMPAPRELSPALRTWVMGRPEVLRGVTWATMPAAIGTAATLMYAVLDTIFGEGSFLRILAQASPVLLRLWLFAGTLWGLLGASRVLELRRLLRTGVTLPQLRAALRFRDEQYEEENATAPLPQRVPRLLWLATVAHAVGAVAALVLMVVGSVLVSEGVKMAVWLQLAASAFFDIFKYTLLPTVALTVFFPGRRVNVRPLFWRQRLRLWLSEWGDRAARLAAWRLPKRAELPGATANLPTELALEDATLAIYAALPPAQQQELRDLKPTVERLARFAERERRAERAAPGSAKRLAEAIDALETLRLGLLKLRAGSMPLQHLTTDLQRAGELSRTVERLDGAQREVERLLQKDEPD